MAHGAGRKAIRGKIGYINEDDYKYLEAECKAISGMTMRLIQARSKS